MIEIRNLVHRYEGTTAVDDVSLTIPDGEFLVLTGANGSGKTTLVRHCNGLLEPTAGEVLVDGTPVEEDPVAARTAVGMTFQNPRDGFVAATLGADVAFGPENLGLERCEIDRRVEEALTAVGLAGREDERLSTLSGGEQQRAAIAGALAMEPTHLILDEPFTGLDAPARTSVLDRLNALRADSTGIVVVTHDLRDLLEPADRVIALANGDVAVDAPPARAVEQLSTVDVRPPGSRSNSDSRGSHT
ncbi:MAG: energy-coupling factor ABC transporter ATP-binding protein [Haloferacaceae archaeon]